MWDLWWTKWHWGKFPPSTSVSTPLQLQETKNDHGSICTFSLSCNFLLTSTRGGCSVGIVRSRTQDTGFSFFFFEGTLFAPQSRRLRVAGKGSLREICGGRSGTGAGISPTTSVFLTVYLSINTAYSRAITGLQLQLSDYTELSPS
jgi:hypothetical protein